MIDWLRNAGSDEWNGQMLNRVADEIDGLNNTIAALRKTLRGHACNADKRMIVGDCVDRKECGCATGLLLVLNPRRVIGTAHVSRSKLSHL